MAKLNLLSQTLIRTTASSPFLFSAATPRYTRYSSVQPEIRFGSISSFAMPRDIRFFSYQPRSRLRAEMEAKAKAKVVKSIEDLTHEFFVMKCKPDWLPLVPGASYWAPPRKSSYGGFSDAVQLLPNVMSDEDYLSLISLYGWPSSAFYLKDDAPSLKSSNETSHEDSEVKSE